jgi:hypothetical protein
MGETESNDVRTGGTRDATAEGICDEEEDSEEEKEAIGEPKTIENRNHGEQCQNKMTRMEALGESDTDARSRGDNRTNARSKSDAEFSQAGSDEAIPISNISNLDSDSEEHSSGSHMRIKENSHGDPQVIPLNLRPEDTVPKDAGNTSEKIAVVENPNRNAPEQMSEPRPLENNDDNANDQGNRNAPLSFKIHSLSSDISGSSGARPEISSLEIPSLTTEPAITSDSLKTTSDSPKATPRTPTATGPLVPTDETNRSDCIEETTALNKPLESKGINESDKTELQSPPASAPVSPPLSPPAVTVSGMACTPPRSTLSERNLSFEGDLSAMKGIQEACKLVSEQMNAMVRVGEKAGGECEKDVVEDEEHDSMSVTVENNAGENGLTDRTATSSKFDAGSNAKREDTDLSDPVQTETQTATTPETQPLNSPDAHQLLHEAQKELQQLREAAAAERETANEQRLANEQLLRDHNVANDLIHEHNIQLQNIREENEEALRKQNERIEELEVIEEGRMRKQTEIAVALEEERRTKHMELGLERARYTRALQAAEACLARETTSKMALQCFAKWSQYTFGEEMK